MQVNIDMTGQVVFFTPQGKALAGAPPRGYQAKEGGGGDGSPARDGPVSSTRSSPPNPIPGAPLWKCDRDIPWAVEARVWEALDAPSTLAASTARSFSSFR